MSPEPPPAVRFADYLAATDRSLSDAGEALAAREDEARQDAQAIAFATGGRRPPASAPAPVEAAGDVIEAGFDALNLHATRLAGAPALAPAPTPAGLARQAEEGLSELRRAGVGVTPEARRAGLAAIAALAAPPAAGATPATLAAERQPSVEAVIALMREVIGTTPRAGLRGALGRQRAQSARNRATLLAAARRDRSLGVMDRYGLYRSAAGDDGDAAEDTLEAALEALARIPPAHAALSGPPAEADRALGALGAALVQLQATQAVLPPGD
jgi:hypothetical protein